MSIYLVMDLVFIGLILFFDVTILRTNVWRLKSTWMSFGILLILTLVFDTLLTSLPIVTYDYTKLLGIYAGSIPIEDLAYTLAVALLVPMLKRVIHE